MSSTDQRVRAACLRLIAGGRLQPLGLREWEDVTHAFGAGSNAAYGVLWSLAQQAWDCSRTRKLQLRVIGDGWTVDLLVADLQPGASIPRLWLNESGAPFLSREERGFGMNLHACQLDAALAALEGAASQCDPIRDAAGD